MNFTRWINSLLTARTSSTRPVRHSGKLWCEVLEDRTVLATLVTGAAVGEAGVVRVTDDATGQQITSFLPYGEGFLGGVNVASGDVDGDGDADVVTGAGAGGGPHVRVFDVATGAELHSFFAYDRSFRGGVNVGTGDVTGDGKADIITGAGAGGGPHVKVFDGHTGAEVRSFFAYEVPFLGGVNVASGDVDGDGFADVITGAGAGGGPHVRVFSGKTGALMREFFAYEVPFLGGVTVASGDLDGDGKADIITGAGAGGGPHVKVFDGSTGSTVSSFFAFDVGFRGGVRIGVGTDTNGDGKPDLTVGANGTSNYATFTSTGSSLSNGTLPGGLSGGVGFVPPQSPPVQPTPPAPPAPPVPPAPSNTAPVLASIGEQTGTTDSPVTFSLTATDADATDALTFSATDLPLGATLDASTGAFAWTPASIQFGTFVVLFSVSDGTATDSESVTFTIADGNVAPVITSDGGGSSAALNVPENTTAVTTVSATDANVGAILNYAIVGGADAGFFSIDPTTGVLTFTAAPDFEMPDDLNHDNMYEVTVGVSDGTATDTQMLTVTVTNENDNSPVITSDGGGSSANLSVPENTTAVTTVTATDADSGATLTYSISGTDASAFTIDATTGVLTFNSPPHFGSPTDVGANNIYDVTVTVSDGTFSDTQTLAVTVTSTNSAPVVTTTAGTTMYTFGNPAVVIDGGITVTDADAGDLMVGATVDSGFNFAPGDVLSFDTSLASGFGISGSYDGVTTGVLTFTGSATAAEYQAVLRTVKFSTNVEANITIPYTFTVDDGDDTGSDSRNVLVFVVP